MDPIIGGLITGGASLLGNIFSSQTSAANTQAQIMAQASNQLQAEQFNSDQSQINREFQANQVNQQELFQNQMSSTAYQRASADMKAAGLNPAAMFGSGSAASSPSGAAASGSAASVGTPSALMPTRTSPLANLGDAVTKAISSAGALQGMEKQTAEIEKSKEEAKSAYYDQYLKSMSLPEADRKAAEQSWINQHPDWVRQKAESEYKGEMFGASGTTANTVARGAATVKGTVADKVIPWFNDRITEATGPTGQKLWDMARQAGRQFNPWKFDNPNIRGTTLNPDYGSVQ